ncbi:MAG: Rieske (2Fe-2S) protein [Chloroflexi bacterium]|nr:Rieske (2Fe-2S) protein [Chloroflexota bacterium]
MATGLESANLEHAEALTRVCTLTELSQRGCAVVSGGRHGIAVFYNDGDPRAVDNRCPHMGFPLSRGSCADGILTCHWHHARFDLASGGTFDPFADDVRTYPVVVRDGHVFVNTRIPATGQAAHLKERLRDGLEQNLSLIIIKSVLGLLELDVPASEILTLGGRFGTRYRRSGWGPGLTILTALASILDDLRPEDRYLALAHGLQHVASDCAGSAPRFWLDSLPETSTSLERLLQWFRRFAKVRDSDGCERTLLTAIRSGASPQALTHMLVTAATDHYFLAGGHTIDFINKATELLDQIGWDQAAGILPSVIGGITGGQRSEEQNAWRHPIDLVSLLETAIAKLPDTAQRLAGESNWNGFDALSDTLLGDDPQASIESLLQALRSGATLTELSQTVAYTAARRIFHFHTSNEFGDWITVLHTFTYCNAMDRCLRRSPSLEAARGVFHGAMKIYLDRFLNTPPARLPRRRTSYAGADDPAAMLRLLEDCLDRQQQVTPAAELTDEYLSKGGNVADLLRCFGQLLLREDAEFHTYQMVEAGIRQYQALQERHPAAARTVLIAIARYLAAHAPTSRAFLQTARNALRLQRGEELYTEAELPSA